ncbi:MAG: hypothetical protein ACREKI_05875 [Gemmatimonadota bacterium]
MSRQRWIVWAWGIVWLPGAVAAQDTVTVGVAVVSPAQEQQDLLREAAERAVAFYNELRTIRLQGRTFIPSGRGLDGDVGVLGGPVDVQGRVAGDLVVINADLLLAASARVDGDVVVVGGRVRREEGAVVLGDVESYAGAVTVQRVDDTLVLVDIAGEPRRSPFLWPIWSLGNSDLLISGGTYNRIEGLPIAIGPRVVSGGANPLRLELQGIYRSQSGFDPAGDEFGYRLRARQYVGGHRDVWLDASLHSTIEPIETRGLTDLEAGLSTFFLHRDYRDHYDRVGWTAGIGWDDEHRPWNAHLEFRDERHDSAPLAGADDDPWTLAQNDDPFRPNALIDEGDLQSLLLDLRYDTRNDPDRPWTGWWIRTSYEIALGGRLSGVKPTFHDWELDLRRYNRVSPSAGIDVRVALGGRIGGGALPAQRQHALGAEGSLPAYQRFEFDCGWRAAGGTIGTEPGYGCERYALVQVQYRGSPRFKIGWGGDSDEPGPDRFRLRLEPALVLFYDVGTAWDVTGFWSHLTQSRNWVADIGFGVELGGPGIYVALPLREGAKGSNFFIRLARRI